MYFNFGKAIMTYYLQEIYAHAVIESQKGKDVR